MRCSSARVAPARTVRKAPDRRRKPSMRTLLIPRYPSGEAARSAGRSKTRPVGHAQGMGTTAPGRSVPEGVRRGRVSELLGVRREPRPHNPFGGLPLPSARRTSPRHPNPRPAAPRSPSESHRVSGALVAEARRPGGACGRSHERGRAGAGCLHLGLRNRDPARTSFGRLPSGPAHSTPRAPARAGSHAVRLFGALRRPASRWPKSRDTWPTQRSCSRRSASSLDGGRWPGVSRSAWGRSSNEPSAGSISPFERSRSNGPPSGYGVSKATGRP
jgi:hypothetical protein